jgi:hypothetical protein
MLGLRRAARASGPVGGAFTMPEGLIPSRDLHESLYRYPSAAKNSMGALAYAQIAYGQPRAATTMSLSRGLKSHSIRYSIVGGHLRVPPLFRADTQVRPYKQITVFLQLSLKGTSGA